MKARLCGLMMLLSFLLAPGCREDEADGGGARDGGDIVMAEDGGLGDLAFDDASPREDRLPEDIVPSPDALLANEAEWCRDGLDNDGDGASDCFDLDCWQSEECVAEDCDSVEPGYCLIGAGTFLMGCDSDDWECGTSYNPWQHQVTISRSFLMKATEVTQGEWEALMGANPSEPYSIPCGPDCPVTDVNWWEAVNYCNTLSQEQGLEECYNLEGCRPKRDGLDCTLEGCETVWDGISCESVEFLGLDCQGYRLPTDAEWEYAARGGTDTAYYTGDAINIYEEDLNLDRAGWYQSNCAVTYEGCLDMTEDDGPYCGGIHPAGEKEPNRWGLYDTLGNVMEWVWDPWIDSWAELPLEPATDPITAAEGDARILRGGSIFDPPMYCQVWYHGPGAWDEGEPHTGLRPVRTWQAGKQ